MAGVGPAPKDPTRRARRNQDARTPLRLIEAEPAEQPQLPEHAPHPMGWHPQTLKWWKMWADSPLADEFTENDWAELMDTAILHTNLWWGDVKIAGELRLRVAKFGATPEDRARLRIQFATADHAEVKAGGVVPTPRPGASRRRLLGPA